MQAATLITRSLETTEAVLEAASVYYNARGVVHESTALRMETAIGYMRLGQFRRAEGLASAGRKTERGARFFRAVKKARETSEKHAAAVDDVVHGRRARIAV